MTPEETPIHRAIEAAKHAMGPHAYGSPDKPFLCAYCGHDRFAIGDYVVLLLMHTLVCGKCGHVDFFKHRPEPLEL